MRRYGNVFGVLLAGLAGLLGAALLLRLAWNWSIGPVPFRHVLGFLLLGLIAAGLLRLGRHRDGWRHFGGRW